MPAAENIRNFCIIAHIDHGKSTLADRMLMGTGAMDQRTQRDQALDEMDLERERGITIKSSAVSVEHVCDGVNYELNFIDTPGHVDFHYEVSRALAACEGAILVVDAAQGVEAQTVANLYKAVDENLELIPVVNKIDLPAAQPEDMALQVEQVLGLDPDDCIFTSAKTGQGIGELLDAICRRFPPPQGDPESKTQALIFDAEYDDYRGVIVYFRMMNGRLRVGQKIRMMGTGRTYGITELGKFKPKMESSDEPFEAGDVGYMVAAIKTLGDVNIGDTITLDTDPADAQWPGYREPVPMVFCDFYPTGDTQFADLRQAIQRLHLNDASFHYEPTHSEALGPGFRCGFLGMLHMDIIQERLERERNANLVQTAPTVTYEIKLRGETTGKRDEGTKRGGKSDEATKRRSDGVGEVGEAGEKARRHEGTEARREKDEALTIRITNPADLPDPSKIAEIREPIVHAEIITPSDSIGEIMKLCETRRGVYKTQKYLSDNRQILEYQLPLAEIIFDFFDKLKSITSGYGTVDYEISGFQRDELVKMDILVNQQRVDALSVIVHRSKAEMRGRALLQRLQKQIDKHMFEIPLQAAIGGKIIARETIKSMGKNVTAKCYGGDVTRKRKLLEKQKKGKERMKTVGAVDIPQEAFMAVLDTGE